MTMIGVSIPIGCVLLGTVRPFGSKGVPSGIVKQAVDGAVRVTVPGLART